MAITSPSASAEDYKTVSMTDLIQHLYGIYDQIYDWNGIYDDSG